MKKFIPILIFIPFVFIMGCNSPGSGSSVRREIGIGAPAPDVMLRDLTEKNLSLSDYKGKVLLLSFWKVKCRDCVKTLPSIEALSKQLENPDFAILAVNVDNLEYVKPEKIHAFLREHKLTFRVAADETFSASEAYKILAVPMTYLIDKKGVIADIKFGEQDWTTQENMEKIQALLK